MLKHSTNIFDHLLYYKNWVYLVNKTVLGSALWSLPSAEVEKQKLNKLNMEINTCINTNCETIMGMVGL